MSTPLEENWLCSSQTTTVAKGNEVTSSDNAATSKGFNLAR